MKNVHISTHLLFFTEKGYFFLHLIEVVRMLILIDGLGHGLRTPDEEIAFTARPKIISQFQFLGTAESYFVCHIGPKFQNSLIYAFIGCP